MDWTTARARYAFLADAFDASGGFAPSVTWGTETLPDGTTRTVPKSAGQSYLIPHRRETADKYAARCALATYENHLRTACERFVAYLGRRRAIRDGVAAGLSATFLADCDMRGTTLDGFFVALALDLKARGSMLLVLDAPKDLGTTAADQQAARALPYLRAIRPETVAEFDQDDRTGLFSRVEVHDTHLVDGERVQVTREWTATTWAVYDGKKQALESGEHGFGMCPVVAVTESGSLFPHVGKYSQIADLSRSIYNKRSWRDEILSGPAFPLLSLQLPKDASIQTVPDLTAQIGTQSLLTHQGDTPAYVSPDGKDVESLTMAIGELEEAIKRISYEDATTSGAQQESGTARRLRFEALNADLSTFAGQLQRAERLVWAMFAKWGTTTAPTVEWPSDYNLVDTLAELDILTAMQSTGFPDLVLAEKRRSIAGAEFDAADEATKSAIKTSLDRQAQAGAVL